MAAAKPKPATRSTPPKAPAPKAAPSPPARKAAAVASPPARPAPKVAFPKKGQPPSHAEFAARLPAAVGKRFEAVRAYLEKQDVVEDFYYYGPRTGWAYRFQHGASSLCSIMLMKGRLVGIIALDAPAQAKVSWDALSDVARRARKVAHGTPAVLWLDVPLDGTGATDFKSLLKAKLAG
jgi:hypothetical protein